MPELPDIEAYLFALRSRIVGQTLLRVRVEGVFFLRTVTPPLSAFEDRKVLELRRIGKRIAIGCEQDLWLVIHLMIAGRLHWKEMGAKLVKRRGVAAFDFANGTLTVTEAGSKRRASLYAVRGEEQLLAMDPGGVDVLSTSLESFRTALSGENRTLKRALTDPRVVSGIGNAYSDEILHRAKLSPILLTGRLSDEQWQRLFEATQKTLVEWRDLMIDEAGRAFPEKVTAFRPEMGAHGRFGKDCVDCGELIQRIRYADNETNYCPRCQTEGKLLADRSLSRLLRKNWPKTLDELEALKRGSK